MPTIPEVIGERIKYFRKQRKLSREKLSELADLHPTYIGQLERGEKNPSVETIFKICVGLDLPVSSFLEKVDEYQTTEYTIHNQKIAPEDNFPLKAYELLYTESRDNQKLLYELLLMAKQYDK